MASVRLEPNPCNRSRTATLVRWVLSPTRQQHIQEFRLLLRLFRSVREKAHMENIEGDFEATWLIGNGH